MAKISKEMQNTLRPILGADDAVKFKELLEKEKEYELSWETYTDVLDECFGNKAKKCALVLLKGELGDFPAANFDRFILNQALSLLCDPEIIRPLLEDCNAHDQANDPFDGFLPIHIFMWKTTRMFPLTKWARDESLITLIILLCHPALKKRLEVAKLLAEHTESLSAVALGFLSNGDVAELAALLLVAHPTILEPLNSAPTIEVKGLDDLKSRAIHGNLPNPAGYALIDLFNKAGVTLSQYWSSIREDVSPVDVIKQVAVVIRKAGVSITPKDVDFYDILCLDLEVMDSINESLGFKKDDGVDKSQECGFLSVRSARFMSWPDVCIPTDKEGVTEVNEKIYKRLTSSSAGRCYSTAAVQAQAQAHKVGACSRPSPPSKVMGRMPFLAMRLARGIKYL